MAVLRFCSCSSQKRSFSVAPDRLSGGELDITDTHDTLGRSAITPHLSHALARTHARTHSDTQRLSQTYSQAGLERKREGEQGKGVLMETSFFGGGAAKASDGRRLQLRRLGLSPVTFIKSAPPRYRRRRAGSKKEARFSSRLIKLTLQLDRVWSSPSPPPRRRLHARSKVVSRRNSPIAKSAYTPPSTLIRTFAGQDRLLASFGARLRARWAVLI